MKNSLEKVVKVYKSKDVKLYGNGYNLLFAIDDNFLTYEQFNGRKIAFRRKENVNLKGYKLINDEQIDKLGMILNKNIANEITKVYTTSTLIKWVKDYTRGARFQKIPTDQAWVSVWNDMICVSDKNNHWGLAQRWGEYNLSKIDICLYQGGNLTPWPFDAVPIIDQVYKPDKPGIPLNAIIKTLQNDYTRVYDPFAWKGDKISFNVG
jgi:hypothetical protein